MLLLGEKGGGVGASFLSLTAFGSSVRLKTFTFLLSLQHSLPVSQPETTFCSHIHLGAPCWEAAVFAHRSALGELCCAAARGRKGLLRGK